MATYTWIGGTSGAWATAANWFPASVPGAGDSVVFDGNAVGPLTAGPSGTPLLASVRIKQTLQNAYYVGAPAAPIAVGATSFIVGENSVDGANSSSGCQQICWAFGSAQTLIRVIQTNTSGLNGSECLRFTGNHASNSLNLEGPCSVGAGTMSPTDTYTLAEINVNDDGAILNLGAGGTLTTINQQAGSVVLNSALTTLHQEGGTCRSEGNGTITLASIGGTAIFNSTGTIATLDVIDGGSADFSQSAIARTVTTTKIHGTGRLTTNNGKPLSITFTNGVNVKDAARLDQLDLGRNVNLAITAAA